MKVQADGLLQGQTSRLSKAPFWSHSDRCLSLWITMSLTIVPVRIWSELLISFSETVHFASVTRMGVNRGHLNGITQVPKHYIWLDASLVVQMQGNYAGIVFWPDSHRWPHACLFYIHREWIRLEEKFNLLQSCELLWLQEKKNNCICKPRIENPE